MNPVLDRLRTQHARNAAAGGSQPRPDMMTDKQRAFIGSLLEQWVEFEPPEAGAAAVWIGDRISTMTRERASEVIERLLKRVTEAKRRQSVPNDRPSVPAGLYALESPDGTIHFYRVYITRNGNSYVTLHNAPVPHMPYASAIAALKAIAVDPKGAAIRFGKELGICGRCGRDLTDAESRAAGIGPVCAGKDW